MIGQFFLIISNFLIIVTNSSVISSTFFLTLLMGVGLFFFIRASVKDRTEQLELMTDEADTQLLNQLQKYFLERGYQVIQVNPQQQTMIMEGLVSPSLFLATFLTILAGLGLLCLGLVLALLYPSSHQWFLTVALLSPLAGLFYWKKAKRVEKIALAVKNLSKPQQGNLITLTAHRDELIELQQNFSGKLKIYQD